MGNLDGFDPAADMLAPELLTDVDRWILLRAEDLVLRCRQFYAEFAFHKVYRAIYDFTATDLSALYFDVAKDRLYTAGLKSTARRSAQSALYRITDALVRLLAPILVFTTEEVWGHFRKPESGAGSVHLEMLPEAAELSAGLTLEDRARVEHWAGLLPVREQVLKSLEAARQEKAIGSPLEAHVHLKAGGDVLQLLRAHLADLPGLCIVSEVDVEEGAGEIEIAVRKATGNKCERCWKHLTEVGANAEFPTICNACREALRDVTWQ